MKRCIIFLLAALMFPLYSYAHSMTVSGIVKDSDSGKSLPFVNIAIVGSKKGTTSDSNGKFKLEIDSTDLHSLINFSCLNYDDLRMEVSNLSIGTSNEIILKKTSYEIPEIIISKKRKKQKQIELNKLNESEIHAAVAGTELPIMEARFFPYEKRFEEMDHIKSLRICFMDIDGQKKSKVRIRIFSNNPETNLPKEDMLREDLLVYVKKGINKIDVSKLNLHIPKDGIFIAIEWLIIEENRYVDTVNDQNNIKKTVTFYGPNLGAYFRQDAYAWRYFAGEWRKYKMEFPINRGNRPDIYFDPAISIVLTD